jgi:formate dehydrogenase
VYEVPMGIRLAELIERYGGGVAGGRLGAVLPGGASSAFLPAAAAQTPLDFQALSKAGSMLGSGAVIVIREGRDPVLLARNLIRFFRDESCGKCVPCRVGTEKAFRILEEGAKGREGILEELARAMADASICGLGQAAMNPVLSGLRLLRK